MKVPLAALCDFAQERNGLLSIISAGFNRVSCDSFPSHAGFMLALHIELSPVEAQLPQEVRCRLENADGAIVDSGLLAFQIDEIGAGHDPGEILQLPLVYDCRNVVLPEPGRYQVVIDLMVDDVEPVVLAFRALERGSEA